MNFKQANGENFAQGRTHPIQFLVIHYTANNGDTVQNNLDYFSRNAVGASAPVSYTHLTLPTNRMV